MKIPTLPGSPSSESNIQSSLLIQIPSNPREFQHYLISLKKHLSPLFPSPLNPTLTILSQFYKGSKMVIHNAVLIA